MGLTSLNGCLLSLEFGAAAVTIRKRRTWALAQRLDTANFNSFKPRIQHISTPSCAPCGVVFWFGLQGTVRRIPTRGSSSWCQHSCRTICDYTGDFPFMKPLVSLLREICFLFFLFSCCRSVGCFLFVCLLLVCLLFCFVCCYCRPCCCSAAFAGPLASVKAKCSMCS